MRTFIIAILLICSNAVADIWQWQDIVRTSPYWHSQGSHANLMQVRGWILQQQEYCLDGNRHVLFDHRGQFVGYIDNDEDREINQERINVKRELLADSAVVPIWLKGESNVRGYPFAINCDQPFAYLGDAMARFAGQDEQDLLYGSWNGLSIGSKDQPVSLKQALERVYQHHQLLGITTLPEDVVSLLAAKMLIESGGRSHVVSHTNAKGIMQLMPAVLSDCNIPAAYHFHRIAQMDCALRLLEQNHRNLRPSFELVFGQLPESKREELYSLMLIQAYHGGGGRIRSLLVNEQFNGPALYFAEHHQHFTAGDIAVGLVYHNMGRNGLGFASLYYVSDVSVARDYLCNEQIILGCNLESIMLVRDEQSMDKTQSN